MCGQFLAQGAKIERIYFCPFHPEHGLGEYRRESAFRKPGPGMILQAAREYGLDLARSCLVGDKDTDIQAGLAAGVGFNVLYRPPGAEKQPSLPAGAVVVGSLGEAEQYFIQVARQ